MLEDLPLNSKIHDRNSFRCGEPLLDQFLQKEAAQLEKRNITKTFVLVDPSNPSVIVGFYSLSTAQVDHQDFSEGLKKKLPRYPIPCIRLGRLARSLEYVGHGIGELLIGKALLRCQEVQKIVGAKALIVDAKNSQARDFYIEYGFTPFEYDDYHLFLIL